MLKTKGRFWDTTSRALTEAPAFQQLSCSLCYRWYFDIAKTKIDGF